MPHRKISRPPLEFIDIIYQVANIVKINDIKFVIGFGSDDDMDSFLGDLYKVAISGYRNGQLIKQNYLIKWNPDPERRKSFRNLYMRDYSFHNVVVPKLLEIQRQYKIIEGLKISFPNCVFSRLVQNEACLVFTSIAQYGYDFYDRFSIIDMDHSTLVIKTLAKLHGLSFVLQRIDVEHSKVIKKLYQDDVQYSDPKSISKSILKLFSTSVEVVKNPIYKNTLKDCSKDIFMMLCKCVTPDRYSTICHADCYNNNIFFKYQGKRPVDVLLVDYQISRYASPVTDLSYFFYMSGDKEFLENHYERLLDLYYKTLSAVLRQCNLDVKEIYPEEIFKEHLKMYSVLGLIEALVSMKIITAVPEDAVEMAKMRYEITENVICDGQSQNESLFVKRVNDVVDDFFKRGHSLYAVLNK